MMEGTGGKFSVRESGTKPRALLSACWGEMLHCDSVLGEDPGVAGVAGDNGDTGESGESGDTEDTGEVPAELLTCQEGGGVSVSVLDSG